MTAKFNILEIVKASIVGLFLMCFVSCTSNKSTEMKDQSATAAKNILLEPWTGPYNGIPPLDKINIADFKPALLAAMAEDSMEILKITSNPDTPTFENTIAALELTGSTYLRVFNLFNIWSSNMNTPEFQIIDTEMQPIIAAFNDQINQNEALFKRIEVVYNSPEKQKLTSEQQRLVWKY